MEPFNGTYQHTKPTWCCKACGEGAGSSQNCRLMECPGCKLAYYCNVSCQRQDYKNHKEECERLTQLQNALREETEALESYSDDSEEQERNLFEESAGDFWNVLDTRNYCTTRACLAQEMEDLTMKYEVAPLLEMVVAHNLELLRLNTCDDLGLCSALPLTLLRINQDERCVAFITHWQHLKCNASYAPTVLRLHEQSSVGDWIYGSGDCYADIFEVVPNIAPKDVFLPHLFALCIVKLRIIAKYETERRQLESFHATHVGHLLGDSVLHIDRFVVGDKRDAARVAEQQRHVEHYYDIIHAQNELLLPTMINPCQLHRDSVVKTRGAQSVCHLLLQLQRMFESVPGALERLDRRLGPHPRRLYTPFDCVVM